MNQTKVNKALLRELPYYSCDRISSHGQFNNSLDTCLPTKKYLDRLPSFHDLDLFSLNSLLDKKSDDLSAYTPTTRCKYYFPHSFSQLKRHLNMSSYSNSSFSFFHTNIRSLKRNLENFQTHLLDELTFRFNILGITETRIKSACDNLDFNPTISHYNFEHVPTPLSAGGVGMYIDENLKYTIIEKCSNEAFQALWVELHVPKHANIICGVVYRQHNSPELFQEYFDRTIEKLSASGKQIFLIGDFNINLLRFHDCKYVQNFILSLQSFNVTPTIDKPTRVHN